MLRNDGPYAAELAAAVAAAVAAGEVVKDLYDRSAAATYQKGDGSPVTDADLAADRAIRQILRTHFPADPILSEEEQDNRERLNSARCWIVDPIDGTEQFIRRTGEFDILVAFVADGRPLAVAGYQPTTGTLVTATKGGGAWVRAGDGTKTKVCFAPAQGEPRIATSKWFGSPENAPIIAALSARLGVTADHPTVTGFTPRLFLEPRAIDAMVGVRPGTDQTMASEWDFAVADLVFHEAGGVVSDLLGRRFRYNKPAPRNDGGLIAAVDPATHARILGAMRHVRADLMP